MPSRPLGTVPARCASAGGRGCPRMRHAQGVPLQGKGVLGGQQAVGSEKQHCEVSGCPPPPPHRGPNWAPSHPTWAPPLPAPPGSPAHPAQAKDRARRRLVQCGLLNPSEVRTGFRSSQRRLSSDMGVQGAEGACSPAGDRQLSQSFALDTPSRHWAWLPAGPCPQIMAAERDPQGRSGPWWPRLRPGAAAWF